MDSAWSGSEPISSAIAAAIAALFIFDQNQPHVENGVYGHDVGDAGVSPRGR
jgi:hypothetical protein